MKKLMYLTITFFTFIFSFIAPIKNNFNINIKNNKIVEKLEPKRAFENAPKKEISLPGINKEFKLFFNISNVNEITDLLLSLFNSIEISDIPTILYVGNFENINFVLTAEKENVDIYNNGILNLIALNFTASAFDPIFNFSCAKETNWDTPIINLNGEDISTSNETNDIKVYNVFNNLNEIFISTAFLSLDSFNDINVNTTILNNSNYIYGYDVVSSSLVPGLIGTIGSIASGLLSLLISLFSSVVAIFWNVSNNTPTFLGVVLLFVVAVPITYWVINFVIGLIRKIRLTRGK